MRKDVLFNHLQIWSDAEQSKPLPNHMTGHPFPRNQNQLSRITFCFYKLNFLEPYHHEPILDVLSIGLKERYSKHAYTYLYLSWKTMIAKRLVFLGYKPIDHSPLQKLCAPALVPALASKLSSSLRNSAKSPAN